MSRDAKERSDRAGRIAEAVWKRLRGKSEQREPSETASDGTTVAEGEDDLLNQPADAILLQKLVDG